MFFRDLFVLAFCLAALAGSFAIVSATIQSLFARQPAQRAAMSPDATITPESTPFPAPAPAHTRSLSGPQGVLRHPAMAVTPGGVTAANHRDLEEALLAEALLRQGIDPEALRRATLVPEPVRVPDSVQPITPALPRPGGVLWHPAMVVTSGGAAAASALDLEEALLDEALLRQGIDPVAYRQAQLEATMVRYDASSSTQQDASQPQDVEFWEVEPAPRHDPTV